MTGSTDVSITLAKLDSTKADKSTTYTKTEVDNNLDLKENKSDTITYMVSVQDNKYVINGESQPTLDLFYGNTYIFVMSPSITENFIKFSTTPGGPTEYTEGVTYTELFGKVETIMTFSDLLFNGVNESLEKIELSNQEKLQTWIGSTDLYITQQGTQASPTSIFSDIDDNSVDQFIENLFTAVSDNIIDRNLAILLLQQMADLYDICNYEYKQLSNQVLKNPIKGGGGFQDRYNYDNLEEAQEQCNTMDDCTGVTKDNAGYNLRSSVAVGRNGSTSWQKEKKVCKIKSTMRDTYNITETEITEVQTKYTNDPDSLTKFMVDSVVGLQTEIKIDPTTPTTLYYYSEQQNRMGGRLNIHKLSQKANQGDVTSELALKADKTDVTASLDSLQQELTAPAGSIIMFPSITPPTGYLLCDGQLISETDYPKLYAIVGRNVPDLTDRFVRAPNRDGDNVLQEFEDTTAVNGLRGSANHRHTISSYVDGGSRNRIDSLEISMADGFSTGKKQSNVVTNNTNATVSFEGDRETAPKHIVMAFCIKY